MPSFSIPLSGLKASQQALSVVANNLSNMNTVGYKDQQTNFRDLFYSTVGTNGSGDSLQVGAGTTVDSTTGDFSDGNVATNNVASDIAISGNGFFVVQKDGSTEYTRAGNFQVDTNGNLITQEGQNVMGYTATNGVIDSTSLSPLKISVGSMVPATATSSLQMTTNLSASADTGTTVSNPVTVYDSLGTSHVVTFSFTKTASNSWSYTATIPNTDVGATPSTGTTTVSSGTLSFDSNGNITSATSSTTGQTASATGISGIAVSGLSDGAASMTLDWSLADSTGNSLVTQTSAASGTSASNQNGYASGTLESYTVESDGTIEGTCSNGQSLALGQVALAQFANNQGLTRVGSNCFQATVASGQAVVGTAESGGRGKLTGDALEQSNVDMATEFSQMIVNQRGYEADAKVISAFDQVTQDTIQMQR